MFARVLIANRGEIARRVIRTCDRLAIASVAVFTEFDRGAPHVREAGQAIAITSYLEIDAILDACVSSGADAVHPGYGFLSENPDLARACIAAGVAFVGPPPDAAALMADKIQAKRAAQQAGLPIVPSFTEAQAAADGAEVSYPLLVKAAAGGGGRGMRVVNAPGELAAALASARREARAGFGDDRVFIERFLPRARHIEVQIIADAHGTVLHLGERECSLQRRHQKVIEEAPSPVVTRALRERLGAESVALARASGYEGAGTVEFIAAVEDPAEHYFLEMNARLQVEHPVTEMVTGLDLVELQLRVAAGEPLSIGQQDVRLSGHAIEARITAEDAAQGFLPTTGRVLAYHRPRGARVDDAIETGSQIDTSYDSLLAKVIAHGPDRPRALDELDRALADTAILGLTTTTAFLRPDRRPGGARRGAGHGTDRARDDPTSRTHAGDDRARGGPGDADRRAHRRPGPVCSPRRLAALGPVGGILVAAGGRRRGTAGAGGRPPGGLRAGRRRPGHPAAHDRRRAPQVALRARRRGDLGGDRRWRVGGPRPRRRRSPGRTG